MRSPASAFPGPFLLPRRCGRGRRRFVVWAGRAQEDRRGSTLQDEIGRWSRQWLVEVHAVHRPHLLFEPPIEGLLGGGELLHGTHGVPFQRQDEERTLGRLLEEPAFAREPHPAVEV